MGIPPEKTVTGIPQGKIVMEILQKSVMGIPQEETVTGIPQEDCDGDSPDDGDSSGENCDGDSPDGDSPEDGDGVTQEKTVMGIPLMEIPQKTVMGFTQEKTVMGIPHSSHQ